MTSFKLTKNELRAQQNRLQLLLKYLPTLQLKKALLEFEIADAKIEVANQIKEFDRLKTFAEDFATVLSEAPSFDVSSAVKVKAIKKHYENIAGVEIPKLDEIIFEPFEYTLFDTPIWIDSALLNLKKMVNAQVLRDIAIEKKNALEKELREVSIRVNLFEKVLIPRSRENIRVIKIFLGDQALASIARAKVAKSKIQAAKEGLTHAT